MMPVYNNSQQANSPSSNVGASYAVPIPMYNIQGLNMPHYNGNSSANNQNGDIAAYQQNLQRAFLQNAMAQNIQIQQQLLAQNQALQQLLVQSPQNSQSVSE